jgi:2-polyprenyl-6-hydroxyphenyl methylase/3-demethylubiquinone-9 3-methyltransferase
MQGYYTDKLSADRLKKCYEIAPARVKQYFDAEINYVLQKIKSDDIVIELGCGYGRLLPSLAAKAKTIIGIDTSLPSIEMGKKMLEEFSNIFLMQMDAVKLGFEDNIFDVVLCIQNGISAFHVNQADLIHECIRITKPGGIALFSSYSEKFWEHRLKWFQLQAEAGLLGEIDYDKTKNGIIVCKDGFAASTVTPEHFIDLTSNIENISVNITEVDESSVFFEIRPCKK